MLSAPTVGNGLDRSEKTKKAEAYSRPALIQFIETGAHTGAPLQRFLTYSKIVENGLDRSEKRKGGSLLPPCFYIHNFSLNSGKFVIR